MGLKLFVVRNDIAPLQENEPSVLSPVSQMKEKLVMLERRALQLKMYGEPIYQVRKKGNLEVIENLTEIETQAVLLEIMRIRKGIQFSGQG